MSNIKAILKVANDAIAERDRLKAVNADLVEALEETLRYLVTPKGLPDVGKGRTLQQQATYDNAKQAITNTQT